MNQPAPPARSLFSFFPALERLGDHLRRREIPFVQQTMATDCGAASLAMTLGLHGHHVSLEEVRAVLGISRDGVKASAIVEAANRFELEARGVKIALEDLVHLPQGSILHWEFVHYVVFDRMEGDVLHIVDPATGPRKVPAPEARKSVTGVALVLEPRETFVQQKKGESVVLRYLRAALRASQDWGRIAAVSLTIEGLTILLPLITGRLIDRVIPRSDVHLLYVLVGAFSVAAVFYLLAALVRGHLMLHLKTRFDTRMTMSFVHHVLRLPYEFFELRQPADLQMRVSSIQQIREVLTGALLSAGLDGSLVVAHLFFLATMSLRMFGIALVVVSIQGGLYLATRRRLRELSADVLAKQTAASNALNELLTGIESLKAGGVEHRAAQTWAGNYVDVLNVSLRRGSTQATSEALLGMLKISGPVLLLIIGILDVMDRRMSLGTMLSANAMAVGFIMPTMNLLSTLQQLQQARAQLMRIEDVVNTPVEQPEGSRLPAPPLSGRISLDRVSFRYGPKLPLAVKEVSLEIRPGELIAIVGRSGSGKSTLGRLLLGLYQPAEGSIRFDGMPLSQLDLQSVRQQLGVVVQRAHVFGTTVRANIALGEPTMPLEQIMEAAKRARIHEDIASMPMGYDTAIIAGGSSLSGGQRQRIALARALVNRPAALLLDEATSALDAVTEHEVSLQLDELSCTRVVIAHRLSTVVNAHRILVMERGELVEQGTHAELLARGGLYAHLVTMQMGPTPAAAAAPPVPRSARVAAAAPPNVRSLDEQRTRRTQAKARPVELASVIGAGYAAPPRYGFSDEEVTAHDPRYARPSPPPRRS
ncbi:MAG TPA: peptidase domain-containing ABC transporter [Labilithrix sp.]|nr:peptidase domain-containing ABC transporter [Labilithrix sp.]